jgi:retinol dehydrogenase-14
MAEQLLMSDKTVVVTGGTTGIGRATAAGLARLGARVGITGRDLTRTQMAAAQIRAETGNEAVDAFAADLSAQSGVRRLASALLDRYPQINVLVNNVGGHWAKRHLTEDGLERTFAVNHLAPFLLTNLLLDRLRRSAPARVVTVSSMNQGAGRINFADLQSESRYSGYRAYDQSKLANVMFTYEAARRWAGTGVTANVLHPGWVRTSFATEDPPKAYRIVSAILRPLLKTPAQGALTSIYLASSAEVEGVTGQYFVNCRPKRSGRASYDTAVAARLWDVSCELTGLTPPARPQVGSDSISSAGS